MAIYNISNYLMKMEESSMKILFMNGSPNRKETILPVSGGFSGKTGKKYLTVWDIMMD